MMLAEFPALTGSQEVEVNSFGLMWNLITSISQTDYTSALPFLYIDYPRTSKEISVDRLFRNPKDYIRQ